VKGIVDAYGGKVEVESQVGKGSTFFVSIPFKKAPRSSEEQVLSEYGVLQGKTVLVAEDNPVNAEVLKRILGKISVSAVLAVNGREALDIFSSATPGTFFCVLMDIRMPVMDGIESAKAIRLSSHPDAMVIPIIAISANASEQDRTLSLEAGMNAHLAKPVIPRMLFDTLAGLIDQSSSVM
jgi:CheY-like chemotaxis protein